ncbi:MAG: 4-hydroxy-tetrahydrodipicolinate reductase [Sphingomonadales bacterium]|jgi:4-hydroxy-tetrahydrodipicolinate reductase
MTQKPLKIGIIGLSGRMGKSILLEIGEAQDLEFSPTCEKANVLIDFSNVSAVFKNLRLATNALIPLVVGTTGLGETEWDSLKEASKAIPILHSNNMSKGIALFKNLVKKTAVTLEGNVSIEIIETHHIQKIDSPSGTAIMLKNALPSKINVKITSIREGRNIGEHTVRFSNGAEVIELKHFALSRQVFAKGAISASRWLIKQPPGLYSIDDVLEI